MLLCLQLPRLVYRLCHIADKSLVSTTGAFPQKELVPISTYLKPASSILEKLSTGTRYTTESSLHVTLETLNENLVVLPLVVSSVCGEVSVVPVVVFVVFSSIVAS